MTVMRRPPDRPALHARDFEHEGFEWIEGHDADRSLYAWVRKDGAGGEVIVVANMTPVPREAMRLGVPSSESWGQGARAWTEALNTDSVHYGGSNVGNGGRAHAVEPVPSHGRAQSIVLTLPPLATLFLVPAP